MVIRYEIDEEGQGNHSDSGSDLMQPQGDDASANDESTDDDENQNGRSSSHGGKTLLAMQRLNSEDDEEEEQSTVYTAANDSAAAMEEDDESTSSERDEEQMARDNAIDDDDMSQITQDTVIERKGTAAAKKANDKLNKSSGRKKGCTTPSPRKKGGYMATPSSVASEDMSSLAVQGSYVSEMGIKVGHKQPVVMVGPRRIKAGTGAKSADRKKAIDQAREMLVTEVPALPACIAGVVVHSFGKVRPDNSFLSKYSRPNAIHPIGFSCTRYEFSPVHGRIIKMRCDILEGEQGSEMESISECDDEEGPIFAISWGKGIDDEKVSPIQNFDPFEEGKPVNESVDNGGNTERTSTSVDPFIGAKVKVRFDNDWWYSGTVSRFNEIDKKRDEETVFDCKKSWNLTIDYDDGATEDAIYPSREVLLFPANSAVTQRVESIASLACLPGITTVTGKTALEAWGNTLVALGLVDEEILASAYKILDKSREEGIAGAKARLEAIKEQRKQARARHKIRSKGESTGSIHGKSRMKGDDEEGSTVASLGSEDDGRESCSPEEEEHRLQFNNLKTQYEDLLNISRETTNALCDVRLSSIGPLVSNPFKNTSESQQSQWLSTIVRKEKSRMGPTGNKRKIVSSTDLLERMDTFSNTDIERLVEGLPGTDKCPSYVFRACRGGGANAASQAWVHDAKIRAEKEVNKELKLATEISKLERKKEAKRKHREEILANKKKQKLDEEDQKRKEREKKRLRQLSVQVDERLTKEALFQREKVVRSIIRSYEKEKNKRSKAAEAYVAFAVDQGIVDGERDEFSPNINAFAGELPCLSTTYDGDVLRIWDFVHSYRLAFNEGQVSFPSLETLQSSVDSLSAGALVDKSKFSEGVDVLTLLAMNLCKPLIPALIKTLSLSVVSAQQKDYSFTYDPSLTFPVNEFTWREVARLALLVDALCEIGFTKLEAANIIRGYRSGGHPNSKEAKRLRRGEDFALLQLRQSLAESANLTGKQEMNGVKVKVNVPCTPSVQSSSWLFYMHNIKAISSSDNEFNENLRKAHELVKRATDVDVPDKESVLSDLEKCIFLAEEKNERSKARTVAVRLLDRHIKKHHTMKLSEPSKASKGEDQWSGSSNTSTKEQKEKPKVQRTSTLAMADNALSISEKEYSKLVLAREDYMAAAVKLKEDMDRKKLRKSGEDVDDDDDDDDDDEDDDSQVDAADADGVKDKKDEELTKKKSGKDTDDDEDPYDEFCSDDPSAPDLIRRCLVVLRTICRGSGEPFIYPVDPQTSSRYYDSILRPMCLMDIGKMLKNAAKAKQDPAEAVAQFGRDMRLIVHNCICFSGVGAAIVSTAEEMLRVFERLLFEWVLCQDTCQSIEALDDDICLDPHPSDKTGTILVCDRCEGHFNMERLDPPLLQVPQGDWYCPRCLNGKCWAHIDPRLGLRVKKQFDSIGSFYGRIRSVSHEVRNGKSSLSYVVQYDDGDEENWTIDEIDRYLEEEGTHVPPIQCLEAVSESVGYGNGQDCGLGEYVPASLNPKISDASAQAALSSSSFRDIISAIAFLSKDISYLSSSDWLKLLTVLIMKCTTSEKVLEIAGVLENTAAEQLGQDVSKIGEMSKLEQIVPRVSDYEDETDAEESQESESPVNDEVPVKDAAMTLASNEKQESETPDKVMDESEEEEWDDTEGNEKDVDTDAEMIESEAISMDKADDESELVEAVEIDGESDENDTVVEVKVETVTSSADAAPPPPLSAADVAKKKHEAFIAERNARTRGRENCFMAHSISLQMKSTIESFEEDTLTHAIENILTPNDSDLSLSSSLCNGSVCDFCELSDFALGAPLVRTPNMREWSELISHSISKRLCRLVADVSTQEHREGQGSSEPASKLVAVSVRVKNDLVSVPADTLFEGIQNDGMTDFIARNSVGAQNDLKFRHCSQLPFVTGSLSAHDCCAAAAHAARLERLRQKHKDRFADNAERDYGRRCGRTLPVGKDNSGRTYWIFAADPSSMFICKRDALTNINVWHRFSEPEAIASIIVCLDKDDLASEVKRLFPTSNALLPRRRWANILQKRRIKPNLDFVDVDDELAIVKKPTETKIEESEKDKPTDETDVETREPFVEGERVLVESKSVKLLWDASIIAVSVDQESGNVDGYRVHYTDWSSRFDEWVQPLRVVEPSEYNLEVMEEMYEESIVSKKVCSAPSKLHCMGAVKNVHAPRRARGSLAPTSMEEFSNIPANAYSDEHTLSTLKAAILLVETSLAAKFVDTSKKGYWKPDASAGWRVKVKCSKGPSALMECIVMLEDALTRSSKSSSLTVAGSHLIFCQPKYWKAIVDATVASAAMRIFVLDDAIKYVSSKDRSSSSSSKRK